MKKNKQIKSKEIKKNERKPLDKGQIFVKVMAGILACLMLFSVVVSLIYPLI